MADQNIYKKEYIVQYRVMFNNQPIWSEDMENITDSLDLATERLWALIEEDDPQSPTQYRIVERETYTRITETTMDPAWEPEE